MHKFYACSKLQAAIYIIGTLIFATIYRETPLFMPWIFIICATGIKFKNIVKFIFILLSISIPIIMVSSLCGLIDNNIFYRQGGAILTRYSLGFSNPNVASAFLFELFACFVYLRREKYGALENFLALILLIATFWIFHCRTIVVALIILLILINFYRYRNNLSNYLNKFAYFSLVFCPAISFTIAYLYSQGFWIASYTDMIFQHRFRNLGFCLLHYKTKIFGTKINTINDFHIMDNSYGVLLIKFGYFMFFTFIGVQLYLIKRAITAKNIPLLILLTVYLYIGIMETTFYLLPLNITLFALTTILDDDEPSETQTCQVVTA